MKITAHEINLSRDIEQLDRFVSIATDFYKMFLTDGVSYTENACFCEDEAMYAYSQERASEYKEYAKILRAADRRRKIFEQYL